MKRKEIIEKLEASMEACTSEATKTIDGESAYNYWMGRKQAYRDCLALLKKS